MRACSQPGAASVFSLNLSSGGVSEGLTLHNLSERRHRAGQPLEGAWFLGLPMRQWFLKVLLLQMCWVYAEYAERG